MGDSIKKQYKRKEASTTSPVKKSTYPRPRASESSAPKKALSDYKRKKMIDRIRDRLRGGSSY